MAKSLRLYTNQKRRTGHQFDRLFVSNERHHPSLLEQLHDPAAKATATDSVAVSHFRDLSKLHHVVFVRESPLRAWVSFRGDAPLDNVIPDCRVSV